MNFITNFNVYLCFSLILSLASAAYLSDNGCSCAIATTAMSAAPSSLGCKTRLGFDNVTIMTWCPTDQVKNPGCGTFHPGFGRVDTCANAGFLTVEVLPNQVLTEPGQSNLTFFTGQSISLSWTTQLLDSAELITFSVYTPILRNLLGTTTSVAITPSSVTRRISESTGTPVFTLGVPTPVLFSTIVSASTPNGCGGPCVGTNGGSEVKAKNSTQLITILQSRIINVEAFWNNALLTPATTVPFDNQIFIIRWTAVGNADVGTAAITINRCSSGGSGPCNQANPSTSTIIFNSLTVTLGNVTPAVNEATLFFPRTAAGFQGLLYNFVVTVNPGGGAGTYTYASVGFTMGSQPSATPSPTRSQTSSVSPTRSETSSISLTRSISSSPTNSITPTISVTSSVTNSRSPAASPSTPPDLAAILKEQADKQKETAAATNGVVGGVIGGVILIGILGFVIFKVIQRRQSAERRQRKLAATRRATQERETVYGVSISPVDKPSEKDIANLAAYKAATKAQYNPMLKANSLTAPAAKTIGRGSGRNLNRV
jgi:hypothetical protein